MKRRVALAALPICIAGGWLAAPVRWQVTGLSMAPGLAPGDVVASGWCPLLDRWRAPGRGERWTFLEPGGGLAVKRVWGLPGEAIGFADGDLTVDGVVVVKPPSVLGQMALPVAGTIHGDATTAVRIEIDDPALDDVPFAPDERRLLVPVRDVGVTAIVHVAEAAGVRSPEVVIRVGDRAVRVRTRERGRFAIVAGRLDGRFVAAAWPVDEADGGGGLAVPPGAPATWSIDTAWSGDDGVKTFDVAVAGDGLEADVRLERVTPWRDVHHLPAADGTTQWRLGRSECFLLGDFPGGSRDSRHHGPVDMARLRHRVRSGLRR